MKTTYTLDETGEPKIVVESYNFMRVHQGTQVATFDPDGNLAIVQVAIDDEMSKTLGASWSDLMGVAKYALGGAAIAAAAGGPTTPAAVAGGLLGAAKNALSDDGDEVGEACELPPEEPSRKSGKKPKEKAKNQNKENCGNCWDVNAEK